MRDGTPGVMEPGSLGAWGLKERPEDVQTWFQGKDRSMILDAAPEESVYVLVIF